MAQNKKSPTNASTAPRKESANTKKAAKKKSATKKSTRARSTQNTASSVDNFNYEVGKIAAILMSDRVSVVRKAGMRTDLSDPSWDHEFAGAMKRAELILRRLTSRDYDVHVYQVFPEGEKFTEEQILNEFKRVGWKNLKSKEKTMDLMAELHVEFKSYLDEIDESFPPSSTDEIQGAIRAIRNGIDNVWATNPTVRSKFPNLSKNVASFIQQLNSDAVLLTKNEALGEIEFHRQLFDWCFPFEKRGEQQIRRYRPHELFRFAAIRGWQSDKLILTLSDLAAGFIPFPPKNLEWERNFDIFNKSDLDVGDD